jgi:hypothetical protein
MDYEEYKLAKEFLIAKGIYKEHYFQHQHDCYYLENNCHIEERGGHRYLRPSKCAKFILKQGMERFNSHEWGYAYHGTKVDNVVSIIENGLRPANSTLDNGYKIPL